MKKSILLLFLICSFNDAFAQVNTQKGLIIEHNNIRARISTAGIHKRGIDGGFEIPKQGDSIPKVDLLPHFGPVIGAFDLGYNLKLAIESDVPERSDFFGGWEGIANSNQIWTVTREQINAHRADFLDNGFIDNPITKIFAWPGKKNPFSTQYNGFLMDTIVAQNTAEFWDNNQNGRYEPNLGEEPKYTNTEAPHWYNRPSQLVFSPFYTKLPTNPIISHDLLKLEGCLNAYTLDCPGITFFDNSLFLEYKFFNTGPEPIDSVQFGMFTDMNIGKPNDDYIGSAKGTFGNDESLKYLYGYNKKPSFDTLYGEEPPVFGIYPRGFVTTNSVFDSFYYQQKDHAIITYPIETSTQPSITKPTSAGEYYNILSGYWRDGTPLTIGGNGYNPDNPTAEQTQFPYKDRPTNSNGWSELALNNVAWDKKVYLSQGSGRLSIGQGETNIKFALYYDESPNFDTRLDGLDKYNLSLDSIMEFDFFGDNPFDDLPCNPTVANKQIEEKSNSITLFPNPSNSYFTVKTALQTIEKVSIYDIFGRQITTVKNQFINKESMTISSADWPSGTYIVQIMMKNGEKMTKKLIIESR
jgi:Secretion system C-terminal sorting domain